MFLRNVLKGLLIGTVVIAALILRPDFAKATDDNPDIAWKSSLKAKSAVFSPDNQLLAASVDNQVVIHDANSGSVVQTFTGNGGAIRAIVFSQDGQLLLACFSDGTIINWRVSDGELVKSVKLAGLDSIGIATFSPNLDLIAVGVGQADISVKLVDDGTTLVDLPPLSQPYMTLTGLLFSPDQLTLASTYYYGYLFLWSLNEQPTPRHMLSGGEFSTTYSLSFSPDGAFLAAADNDVIVVISMADGLGRTLYYSGNHTANLVIPVAFSPDGLFLSTGSMSYEAGCNLWRVSDWSQVACLPLGGNIQYSPDGRMIAMSGGSLTVYNAPNVFGSIPYDVFPYGNGMHEDLAEFRVQFRDLATNNFINAKKLGVHRCYDGLIFMWSQAPKSDKPLAMLIKGNHWLQKKYIIQQLPQFYLVGDFINGDIDGDNAITVFDYKILSDAFDIYDETDPNYNPYADLDGWPGVSVYDYAILSQNFDLIGDE